MMEEWSSLLQLIHNAPNAEAVLELFSRVDGYEQDTRWRVLLSGVDRLVDLDYPGIQDLLLNLCLTRSDAYEGTLLRSRLTGWLRQQTAEVRDEVIAAVLAEIAKSDAVTQENALWSVLNIGYRSEPMEDTLLDLANGAASPDIAQLSLWCLVWMGYPDRQLLEDTLVAMWPSEGRVPRHLLSCGRMLATPAIFPIVAEQVRRCGLEETHSPFGDITDLLYVLAETTAEHPDLAARAWDAIAQRGYEIWRILSFVSGIVNVIDDPRVVDYFVWALRPDAPQQYGESRFVPAHDRHYFSLRTLNRPSHLEAVRSSIARAPQEDGPLIIEALRLDTTLDTGHSGPFQTSLSHLKELGWEAALRVGTSEVRTWVVEALNDQSPFAVADACRLAAYLNVDEAVPTMSSIAEQEGWDEPNGRHIALGLAVIDALGWMGTPESLEALMKSNVKFESAVRSVGIASTTPRNYGVAFANCILAAKDATPLVACVAKGPTANPRRWIAAASALQMAAALDPALITDNAPTILSLLDQPDISSSEHLNFLIGLIGFLPPDERLADRLVLLGEGEGVGWLDAVDALARWGLLTRYPHLLPKIGLEMSSDESWQPTRRMSFKEAFILRLLFQDDASAFGSAVVSLLKDGHYNEAAQIYGVLSPSNITPAIVDALVERAHSANQPYSAETEPLWVLATIAPARFAKEFDASAVAGLHARARETIVACYAANPILDRIAVLMQFLTDQVLDIRRTAARALADLDQSALEEHARAMAGSPDPTVRGMGLDAARWLASSDLFEAIYIGGAVDREVIVRRTARECKRERKRAAEADTYISKFIELGQDDALACWHYGQALAKVGSDVTSEKLSELMNAPGIKPRVRAYLDHVRSEVDKGWKEWIDKRKDRLED